MKYKVGDKVRIRKDLKVGKIYGEDVFIEDMKCMLGKTATITEIYCEGKKFSIKELGFWSWTPEMVEEVRADKLIFRDNTTILIKDGEKYVAKCEAGDTYDREKGVLMALAKAHGYSYRDIEKMVAEAEIQGSKRVTEIKRLARPGDTVIVIKKGSSPYNEYNVGDILKIVKFDGDTLETRAYYKKELFKYLNPDEYVVLEHYILKGDKKW